MWRAAILIYLYRFLSTASLYRQHPVSLFGEQSSTELRILRISASLDKRYLVTLSSRLGKAKAEALN
jgi:hypothetical protein